MLRTLTWFLFKLIVGFVALSLILTIVFKFVPVPITATMVMDDNALAKDWEPLSEIDRNMVRAVIGSEDAKFCSHEGFDQEAIEKAIKNNASGGRIRGGSTISQQTAKNVFLWQGGGYVRKGFEAYFTLLIEKIWGKRRIMEVYLNIAETGIGTYGAEAGAQRYFGKSAASLTPREAARMAAALPLPKKREVANPTGWLRRYGNQLTARIGTVKRDGLDDCVYE
jgi:monofunctional biosynthetic peptidoglycan transglycosylase